MLDQDVVEHCVWSIVAVGVSTPCPKFNPLIVTVEPPEAAAFLAVVCVIAGASYVNLESRVPTSAVTVTITPTFVPTPADEVQRTDVVLNHDDDAHMVSSIKLVGVTSSTAKFVPDSVITPPPLAAVFSDVALATGASKDSIFKRVPTTAEIVTVPAGVPVAPASCLHTSAVPDSQDVLKQRVLPMRTVVDVAIEPKFKPWTVMLLPSDVA